MDARAPLTASRKSKWVQFNEAIAEQDSEKKKTTCRTRQINVVVPTFVRIATVNPISQPFKPITLELERTLCETFYSYK